MQLISGPDALRRYDRVRRASPPIAMGLDMAIMAGGVSKTMLSVFGANLEADWVGSAGTSSTVDGTALSFWNDSSGKGDSGRNAAQATGTKQPFYKASAIGGQPGVNWDQANSHYKSLVTGTWSATISQPFVVFAVVRPILSTSGNRRICTNAAGTLDMYVVQGTTEHFWASNIDSGVALTNNTNHVLAAVYNGASSKTFVDAKTATATGTNSGMTVGTGFVLGDYAPSLDFLFGFNGYIARIAVASVNPSTQQTNDAMTLLGAQYGVTIGA